MWKYWTVAGPFCALSVLVSSLAHAQQHVAQAPAPGAVLERALDHYATMSLRFVANGQNARYPFATWPFGYGALFGDDEVLLAYRHQEADRAGEPVEGRDADRDRPGPDGVVLAMRFLDPNPETKVEARDPTVTRVNYIIGSLAEQWKTDQPAFGEIAYRNLWAGIDLVFRGDGPKLKYEFVVAPGADTSKIGFWYAGAEGFALDDAGNLRIQTALGPITDVKPVAYQQVGGVRTEVGSRFRLNARDAAPTLVGFDLGDDYDPSRQLVIDPGLVYSTFLGAIYRGWFGYASGGAVDGEGHVYIAMPARSTGENFPTTPGAFDETLEGSTDIVIAKLAADGSDLLFSTYVGGSDFDAPIRMTIDDSGQAYVAAYTYSTDFPTTAGAFDRTYNGGEIDSVLFKLAADGSALEYSTYIGGTGFEKMVGIAVDATGQAYIVGHSDSPDFPTTAGSLDETLNVPGVTPQPPPVVAGCGDYRIPVWYNPAPSISTHDAFAALVSSDGSSLVYSTFLGGSYGDRANAVVIDDAGNAYVLGVTSSVDFPVTGDADELDYLGGDLDGFIAVLDPDGASLSYASFLGGCGAEWPFMEAMDVDGNLYLAGATTSPDYVTTVGAYDTTINGTVDATLTKLTAGALAIDYSTFLGGKGAEYASYVAVDDQGRAYLTGTTQSSNFPVTVGAYDRGLSGVEDAFVTRFSADGSSATYSTYLGGWSSERPFAILLGGPDEVYVVGRTNSLNFPTTPGAFDRLMTWQLTLIEFLTEIDSFVTKMSLPPELP